MAQNRGIDPMGRLDATKKTILDALRDPKQMSDACLTEFINTAETRQEEMRKVVEHNFEMALKDTTKQFEEARNGILMIINTYFESLSVELEARKKSYMEKIALLDSARLTPLDLPKAQTPQTTEQTTKTTSQAQNTKLHRTLCLTGENIKSKQGDIVAAIGTCWGHVYWISSLSSEVVLIRMVSIFHAEELLRLGKIRVPNISSDVIITQWEEDLADGFIAEV